VVEQPNSPPHSVFSSLAV